MKPLTWSTLTFAALVLSLSACPPPGVVCKPGTIPCGIGCVDPASDRRNCGACGTACGSQQDCQEGACTCRPGTVLCGGACVVPDYDAQHCGAGGDAGTCGVACATDQVCERGSCIVGCSLGFTRCGTSCVDVTSDEGHCGACDHACEQGQSCLSSACEYPVVAACYWSGQLVGFDPVSGVKGPLSDVGSNPAALARIQESVFVADGTDRRLYSAEPGTSGRFDRTRLATTTGAVPNQVFIDRPYAYVANAGSGTVQVLQEDQSMGVVTLDAGIEAARHFGTVAEVPLGMNTFPQGVTKIGTTLYVPLYGGYGAEAADAGQAIAKIDVTDPAHPSVLGSISLKNVDLHAFSGGAPVARPWSIVARGGSVYVALNNLNPDTYVPEGPGLLAVIDPVTDAVSTVDLGASDCLNPQWVSTMGTRLIVACGGRIQYSPTFTIEAVTAAGVVALDEHDARLGAWAAVSVGDVDAGFLPLMPGRFAVVGNQVVLGDQNGGRGVVLSVSDAGISEVRGVAQALQLCPVSPVSSVANVADLSAR